MTTEHFAWKPIRVWDMRTRRSTFTWVWLCWYYKSPISLTNYYRLTDDADEPPMARHTHFITNNNKW